MASKYRIKNDRVLHGETVGKKDDVVYRAAYYDYGLASDDEAVTGIAHTSVTHEADGGYPFFTIPTRDLEEIA